MQEILEVEQSCVHSQDSSIDPVGACVGMRGSRVQTIVNELQGKKIDIIKWTEDLPTLISESLSPAEIQRVLIDQDNKRIDNILTEENSSKAMVGEVKMLDWPQNLLTLKLIF